MSEVKIPKGYAKTGPGLGKSVESFSDALKVLSNCSACGCDAQTGLMTQIDALNGNLMGMYIYNGSLVVEDYDTAVANLKTYCAARS